MPHFIYAAVQGTLNGFVRDETNGESLPYVNVFLKDTQWGDATNDRGYFIIHNIPPGPYTIVFSMIGYDKLEKEIQIKANETQTLEVALKSDILEMQDIVKTAERERFEREVEISTTTLSARQLQSFPTLAEADVFRTLQLLPGVVSRNDFSSQLYVRGGSPDQNLVLLDGVTVYNPFHLLGLFSMFNTDAVKEVEFITGGFPAEFGGRLSSVLNITNNDGNSKNFQGRANISLLSAKATLQGPIPNGSYLVSARRTYFDQIFKNTRYDFPYYFYDIQGKINYNIGENHRLTFSGFYGDDKLDFDVESEEEDEDFQVNLNWLWGNRTTSLTWRWLIHPDLFSEVMLTRSNFKLDMDLELINTNAANLMILNGILDHSAKADFSYFGIKDHGIKFGVKHTLFDFQYKFAIDNAELFDYQSKPNLTSLYLQDQFTLTPDLSIKTGARLEHYSLGNRMTLSPRIGFKYRLYPNFALKGSFGLYHQFLTTASSDNQNFNFIDLWFPLTEQYDPLQALHYVGGFEWWLPQDMIFKTEFYYKTMNNLLELNENGDFADESDDFFIADGYSTGFEMLLKRSSGRLQGWLGYTFSITRRTLGDLVFYPKHDRRNNINVVLNYDLGKDWRLGFIFTFGTGTPYTPVLGKYAHYRWNPYHNQTDFEIYNRLGAKNSTRYPTYHRMDLSIRKTWKFWGMTSYPYFQIINVYNRDNVFLYFWDHEANPSTFITVPMFPFLPTLGFEIEF